MNKWFNVVVMVAAIGMSSTALAEQEADPFEGFNRVIFAFNETLDTYFLKPVAKGYDYITPGLVRTGIGNFYNNVGEIPTIANDLFQAKFKQAGHDAARLLINTTVGMAGFIDIGSRIGLELHDEDFGQTLGYWGVGSGPYLMLPFLGPSTARDAVGMFPDYHISPYNKIENESVRYGVRGLQIVDLRANLLEAEKLISGDRYSFFREAFLQRREFLVRDGAMQTDFLDDDDLFDDEDLDESETDDSSDF